MPNFAILRTGKIKSVEQLRHGLRHIYRAGHTMNADEYRKEENSCLVSGTADEALERFRAMLPEKRRKDAVLAIEYLVTASPEAMHGMPEQQRYDYMNRALEWVRERHGAENVFAGSIHRDETTDHMHVYVMPKVGDRLCAQHFLGGPKAMAAMQDDFARRVGEPSGLERGVRRSGRKHTKIREWYEGQNVLDDSLEAALTTIKELGGNALALYSQHYARVRRERLEGVKPEAELATDWGSYQPGR
jgi:hypothetical protein